MAEAQTEQEIKHASPDVKIIIQRHGKTDRTRPKKDDPDELKSKAGWLTPEGIEETKAAARQKTEEILSSGKPVTFFFINSPSVWFSEGLAYGKRAEQTAQVSADEVMSVLIDHNLSPQEAVVHQFVKFSSKTQDKNARVTKPHENLAEPNLYYVDGSANPVAYHQALKEKYGEEWEEGFHKMEEDLDAVRKKTGAQSSQEIAQSVLSFIKLIDRYARFYSRKHPNRLLVFWLDTHGDRMRSTLQYGLGIGDEAKGFTFAPSQTLDLQLKNGSISTNFKDKAYTVDLNVK